MMHEASKRRCNKIKLLPLSFVSKKKRNAGKSSAFMPGTVKFSKQTTETGC